ncbi:MAG: GNAT family N-acetyltransferase [Acidobacteriota bacterium]
MNSLSGQAAPASDFDIKRAAPRDRQSVIALVSKMWGEDISARYRWMYETNPHGRALTWLAIETASGEAVGCTSIFPRRVIIEGRNRLGSIGGDCYIEPRVRRRGLATRLHRASLAGMRMEGVDFMYGPPNPNNLAALVKAGSRLVSAFRRWVRPLDGRSVYRAAFGSEPSKISQRIASLPVMMLDRLTRADKTGLRLEAVTRFGEEFDLLFERVAAGRAVCCARDSSYLRWRYLAGPTRRQIPFAVRRETELEGFVALEFEGDQMAVIDLFTPTDARLIDATLQLLLDHAAASGCASLEISCTPDVIVTPRLRRLGFLSRSERGFQVAAAADDPQLETLIASDSWFFAAADQDMDTFFSSLPE